MSFLSNIFSKLKSGGKFIGSLFSKGFNGIKNLFGGRKPEVIVPDNGNPPNVILPDPNPRDTGNPPSFPTMPLVNGGVAPTDHIRLYNGNYPQNWS